MFQTDLLSSTLTSYLILLPFGAWKDKIYNFQVLFELFLPATWLPIRHTLQRSTDCWQKGLRGSLTGVLV